MTNTLVLITLSLSFIACHRSSDGHYEPSYHYNCYDYYDSWGYYSHTECYYEYYNVAGEKVSSELDIVAEVSDIESFKLERMAQRYAEKFELSQDQALKVAKNVNDFNALEDRSEQDIADFAQRLYGVNPTEVVSAVGKAQVGENDELEALIDSAAKNFNTSRENTKALIKELHSAELNDLGVKL